VVDHRGAKDTGNDREWLFETGGQNERQQLRLVTDFGECNNASRKSRASMALL